MSVVARKIASQLATNEEAYHLLRVHSDPLVVGVIDALEESHKVALEQLGALAEQATVVDLNLRAILERVPS